MSVNPSDQRCVIVMCVTQKTSCLEIVERRIPSLLRGAIAARVHLQNILGLSDIPNGKTVYSYTFPWTLNAEIAMWWVDWYVLICVYETYTRPSVN